MDFLTRFGLSYSRLTILIMVGLILLGLVSYSSFPKREDPEITIRSAVVSASFPGMSPVRIEELIALPIERAAREIAEVDDIETLVTTGSAVITITIEDAVPKSVLDNVLQDVRNKMEDISEELPEGTLGPFVNTDYGDVVAATIAVTGEGFSYAEIEDVAESLRQHVYSVDGVAKATLYGVQDERIWLEIDSRKLAAIGVQLPQVVADLQEQNVIQPAGRLNADGTSIALQASGDFKSVDDIGEVLTKITGLNSFVRLRDLLNVRRGYAAPPVKPVYFNGEPAVIVGVQMAPGTDIQAFGPALKQSVAEFENRQPIGIAFSFSTYQEAKVTDAINGALFSVLQTVLVVVAIMLVFLGLRSALTIAAIVPFTVMFAMLGMRFFGFELEQVSIAAVIISLGLLVDNGLVMVEDIQGNISTGVPPRDAAVRAGRQFFLPLAVASITTVSAFLPMMILEGSEGEYAFSLGAVVGLMLLGSWFTALYILPALCVWFASTPAIKPAQQARSAIFERLTALYTGSLRVALPLSLLVIVACYIAAFGAITLFPLIKSEMFPLSERNQFLIYMDLPKGSDITETRDRALAVEAWLSDRSVNPEISSTTVYVGDGGPRFYLALSPADTNPASAFFLINTHDFEGAVSASKRAWRYLLENHPEARFKTKRLAMGGAESGIVEIKLSGDDAEQLMTLAERVEIAFAGAARVVQNENDWGNKVLTVIINIEQNKARDYGVTSQTIAAALNTHFDGTTISNYREGDSTIPIVVRAAEPFRDSLEDLANISIGADGQIISLDQVANISPSLEFSQMRRENLRRTIKISAKSEILSAAQLLKHVQPQLEALSLPDGFELEIGGEIESSGDVNAKLAAGMPLTLTVMLLALVVQFNSTRRVLMTLMTIPLVLIGAPLALLLTGMPFSFFGTLGLIALAGIIINNAIVLIDQIDIERGEHEILPAIIAASKKRFRPIMLTSLTTVFGLLPMAIGGGALWKPMAALMIGGLIVASILTLYFVPACYYLLMRWGATRHSFTPVKVNT